MVLGYSWLTNQYGLALDNIVAYELVLPNGAITTVDSSTPDLFFGLKVSLPDIGLHSMAKISYRVDITTL